MACGDDGAGDDAAPQRPHDEQPSPQEPPVVLVGCQRDARVRSHAGVCEPASASASRACARRIVTGMSLRAATHALHATIAAMTSICTSMAVFTTAPS